MNREHAGPYVSIPQEQFDSLHAQLQERDEQIAELKYSCQVTMENKDNLKVQLAEKDATIKAMREAMREALEEIEKEARENKYDLIGKIAFFAKALTPASGSRESRTQPTAAARASASTEHKTEHREG